MWPVIIGCYGGVSYIEYITVHVWWFFLQVGYDMSKKAADDCYKKAGMHTLFFYTPALDELAPPKPEAYSKPYYFVLLNNERVIE